MQRPPVAEKVAYNGTTKMSLVASSRCKLPTRIEARYRFRLLATEVTEALGVSSV
ncbi:hypothetical protein [Levilactobacillus huananensis]|uniref:hypothetical protein n=1 Tax=Levilactobacillus huananensis TaxID=2486019 RepID=UPI0013DDF69F|nr:hypothetical protein [Levilactobacillus huananensis]